MNDSKAFFALHYFYCEQEKFFLFSKALSLLKSSKQFKTAAKCKQIDSLWKDAYQITRASQISADVFGLLILLQKANLFQQKMGKWEKLETNFVSNLFSFRIEH